MDRFEIDFDHDRLTITRPAPAGRMALGFLLLFFTLACLTPLGILGVMDDHAAARNELDAAGSLGFTDPHANHFGFLWLVGLGMVTLAIPIYAVRMHRAGTVFCFDRSTDRLTRNGRPMAALHRIEGVCLRRLDDADERALYRLIVQHSDGFELEVDEWYDEAELRVVAREIADWTGAPIVAPPSSDVPVEEIVRSDPWRWS